MLIARGLSKSFGHRCVFRGLSFQVERGTVAAVTGANGSGKSTLLNLLAGLGSVSAGSLTWSESSPEAVLKTRDVATLAAPDAPVYRDLTVAENAAFFSRGRLPAGRPFGSEELRGHLERFDLASRLNSLAGDLSSGLRSRLQLAIATLHGLPLLLLDEPSSNLDSRGRQILQRVLEDHRRLGVALVATNDPDEAAACDVRLEL